MIMRLLLKIINQSDYNLLFFKLNEVVKIVFLNI